MENTPNPIQTTKTKDHTCLGTKITWVMIAKLFSTQYYVHINPFKISIT